MIEEKFGVKFNVYSKQPHSWNQFSTSYVCMPYGLQNIWCEFFIWSYRKITWEELGYLKIDIKSAAIKTEQCIKTMLRYIFIHWCSSVNSADFQQLFTSREFSWIVLTRTALPLFLGATNCTFSCLVQWFLCSWFMYLSCLQHNCIVIEEWDIHFIIYYELWFLYLCWSCTWFSVYLSLIQI